MQPNKYIGCSRDGVANLREPLDEGAQRLSQALLDRMEVCLVARARIGTLEVGHELKAQLFPRGKGPLGHVDEP
jgi:hypothetical protein